MEIIIWVSIYACLLCARKTSMPSAYIKSSIPVANLCSSYWHQRDCISWYMEKSGYNLIPETFSFTHSIILSPGALRSQFYLTAIIFDILINILEESPTFWIVLLMFWSFLLIFHMCVYVIYIYICYILYITIF